MQKRAEMAQGQIDRETEIPKSIPFWHRVKQKEINKSPSKNPLIALLSVGAIYAAFNKMMSLGGKLPMGQLEQLLLKQPWLWPILLGGTAYAATKAQDIFLSKNASYLSTVSKVSKTTPLIGPFLKSMLIAVPGTYMYAGHAEAKTRRGEPIGDITNIIRKYPFMSSLVSGGLLWKVLKKSPFTKTAEFGDVLYNLNSEALNNLYNDIIS